jgi:AsmA protein
MLWSALSVAAVALLMVVLFAALIFLVDPNSFRARIESAATHQLGRPVRLQGDLRWQVGRTLNIGSDGGQIGNAPGFGSQPFASWRHLQAGVALRPLLNKQIVINALVVEGLTVSLQRRASGETNWQVANAQPSSDSKTSFSLSSIALRDADIEYRDESAAWRLTRLQLHADVSAARTPVRELGDIQLAGVLTGPSFSVQGIALQFAADHLTFNGNTSSLDLPAFSARLNETKISGHVHAAFAAGPSAEGALHVSTPELRTALAAFGVKMPLTADAAAFGRADLDAQFHATPQALSTTQLNLHLDDTALAGDLALPTVSPLSLRFNLTADRMNLDRYLEPGSVQSAPLVLPLAAMKSLDAQGVLTIRDAILAGVSARGVRIQVE